MREATKAQVKEMIDYFESHDRNKRTTCYYFFRTKKIKHETTDRWIRRYLKQGISILETQRKIHKKPKIVLKPETIETCKRVLDLLKEDPTISNHEGGQILGISPGLFGRNKRRLLLPGQLTEDMKIQLGLIPGPGQAQPVQATPSTSKTSNANVPNVKKEKLDSGNDDDVLPMFEVEYIYPEVDIETNPTSSSTSKRKSRLPSQSKHCLLCFIPIQDSPKSPKTTRSQSRRENPSVPIPILDSYSSSLLQSGDNDNGELEENLNVIFALKNVFNLTSDDLLNFMKTSKGKDPRRWYELCGECEGMMKEVVAIQQQVLQLSRELEKCKRKIRKKVEKSINLHPPKVNDDLVVTKLIRETIVPSSLKGKKKANDYANVVVKNEPIEFEDTCENFDLNFNDPTHDNDLQTELETERETTPAPSTSASTENVLDHIFTTSSEIGGEIAVTSLRDLKLKPKLIVCEICGEEMRLHSLPLHSLRVHDIVMEGYSAYKCQKGACKYVTVYKCNLEDHVKKVHVKYKKFKCQFCGKRFKTSGYLRNHETIHKNAESRPYQCELCGQGFTGFSILWCHVKGVHEGYVSPFRRRLMAQTKAKSKSKEPPVSSASSTRVSSESIVTTPQITATSIPISTTATTIPEVPSTIIPVFNPESAPATLTTTFGSSGSGVDQFHELEFVNF